MAWDVRREDWRTFRIDRASRPRLAGLRVPRRELPAADAASYVRQSLAAWQPGHDAVVVLHAPRGEVAPMLARSGGTLEAVDGGTCRLRITTDSIEWLALRLAMLGVELTVESPPELLACLHDTGARMARATAMT